MSQTSAGNDDMDGQAIKRAAEAFSKLPGGSQMFKDCVANTDTIDKLIEFIKDGFASRRKTKGNRLLEVFEKHTAGLRNLSGAIDVAVQTRADIVCPIWAPIKLLLLVSDFHATVVSQIKTMIQTIAEHLPQLELYKKLGANPSLHTALLNVFTDVVEFCVVVHSHISQGLLTRIWKLSMSSFRQDFQYRTERLKGHVKIVNDNALAIELVRASEFRREDVRFKCQTWLNAANMNQVHQSRLLTKLTGTCEWLWSHSAYKAWEAVQSVAADRTLCISGKSGCGKSILASSLVDSLRQRGRHTIYFSFSGTDVSRSRQDHLVRSLLWQVLQDPRYGTGLEVMQQLMADGPPATMDLWAALYQILEPITDPICYVIDGVDECSDSMSDLLGRISRLLVLSESSKTIILGRPHVLEPDAISGHFIDMATSLVEGDLHSFITAKVNQHDNLQRLGTKDAVLSTMLKKSDGMFLWAKLMVADLSTASSTKEVKHKMQHQPRGLEAAYRQILLQLLQTLDELELRLAQCLLGLIAVAGRPLDVEELNYAQAWVLRAQDDSSMNSALDEYLLLDATKKIRRVCGGLIDINTKDSMVSLIHVTAKEFLIRPMEAWGEHKSSIALFRTCPQTSHQLLSLACLEHLARFGTKLTSKDNDEAAPAVDPSFPLLEYAADFAFYHLNRAADLDPGSIAKIRNLIATDGCLCWIEYLLVSNLDESASAAAMTFAEARYFWEAGNLQAEIKHHLISGVKERATKCQSELGGGHWRTVQFQMLLDLLEGDRPSTTSPSAGTSLAPAHAPLHTQTPSHTHAPERVSELVQLLQTHDVLSSQMRVQLFLTLSKAMQGLKALTDPLQLLFRLILSKVATMPVAVLYMVGNFYLNVNKPKEALQFLMVALRRDEDSSLVPRSEISNSVGRANLSLKQYEAAEAFFREAIETMRATVEQYSLNRADVLGYPGASLYSRNEFASAETQSRRAGYHYTSLRSSASAVDIGRSHDPDSLRLAVYLNYLGNALYHQDKLADAETAYQQAVDIRRVHDLDSHNLAIELNSLGNALYHQDKLADAKTAYQQAIDIRRVHDPGSFKLAI